jgi:hypothetical protein
MADLEAGEEERNPIFFALILQMISMTLIHVGSLWVIVLMSSYQSLTFQYPQRTSGHARIDVCEEQMLLPTGMPRDWYWICVLSSTSPQPFRRAQADKYRFFMFVVHNKRGDIGLEAATFGEAQYIAICLGMHREDVS